MSLAGCVQLFLGCLEVIVAYVLLEHQKTPSIANALRTHSTTYVNIAALTYVDGILSLLYENKNYDTLRACRSIDVRRKGAQLM